MDDNIRFFQDLTEGNLQSLFSHPYTAMLEELHKCYGVKSQLNVFYENPSFSLSSMTDKYREEWMQNANWLKLSFHSRLNNFSPYEQSGYQEVYEDCNKVHKEILRFAGDRSLAKTTTLHYARATVEGIRALQDCGVKGLLGLYGTAERPRPSYASSIEDVPLLRAGKITKSGRMSFAGIDIVLDRFTIEECLLKLQEIKDREIAKVLIHEQYFYQDFERYQSDFKEKLQTVFAFLTENGFTSAFFEELI